MVKVMKKLKLDRMVKKKGKKVNTFRAMMKSTKKKTAKTSARKSLIKKLKKPKAKASQGASNRVYAVFVPAPSPSKYMGFALYGAHHGEDVAGFYTTVKKANKALVECLRLYKDKKLGTPKRAIQAAIPGIIRKAKAGKLTKAKGCYEAEIRIGEEPYDVMFYAERIIPNTDDWETNITRYDVNGKEYKPKEESVPSLITGSKVYAVFTQTHHSAERPKKQTNNDQDRGAFQGMYTTQVKTNNAITGGVTPQKGKFAKRHLLEKGKNGCYDRKLIEYDGEGTAYQLHTYAEVFTLDAKPRI